MPYITRQDYIDKNILTEEVLNELTEFRDDIVTSTAKTVESLITDDMNARYDIGTELNKTGDARHESVLFHGLGIGAYIMHKAQAPNQVPENILDGYIEAKEWFAAVNEGKKNPIGISAYSGTDRDFIKHGGETRRANRI